MAAIPLVARSVEVKWSHPGLTVRMHLSLGAQYRLGIG